ncbi:MAG: mannosyltransferase family protein [Actinomycetota bacterium]
MPGPAPAPADPPASAARSAARAWLHAILTGLAAWALLRLVATAAAFASAGLLAGGLTIQVPGYVPPHFAGGDEALLGVWLRADALWYLRIAESGYRGDPGTFAFLPLFPILTRALTPLVGGNEVIAALIVANAACLIGLVVLCRLVDLLIGPSAARAAAFGLALSPTAFFLVAPYAEPLLLAAGACALLAVARGHPAVAWMAGVLAGLARPFGVLLSIPMLALAKRGAGRTWAAATGPLVGLGIWLAWVWAVTSEPTGGLGVQSRWQRTLTLPVVTLLEGAKAWWRLRATDFGPYFLLDLAAAAALVAMAIGLLFVQRRHGGAALLGFAAYTAAVMGAALVAPFPPRPLLSLPRFVLAAFPGFAACALIPRRARVPLAVLSAAGLGALTALFIAARPIF